MVELGGFDILGYVDKMYYNVVCYCFGLLDEFWYDVLIYDYFFVVVVKGYIVEINIKVLYYLNIFFLNEWYFLLLKELGVCVQVNSDLYYFEWINSGCFEVLVVLQKVGFEIVIEWYGGKWIEMLF